MLNFLRRSFRIEECVEQAFFKVILAIAAFGAGAVMVFDLLLTPRTDNNVQLIFLLMQIALLALYAVDRINFQIVTAGVILMMCILFTYRGLSSEEFNEVTSAQLITVGFIAALVSKQRIGTLLKVVVLACLISVLFKHYGRIPTVILVRQAIPYMILFCIVTICSGLLKSRYEWNQDRLKAMVTLLRKKNKKINQQNELLNKRFEELAYLNGNLEAIIQEKTSKISEKNAHLAQIAYANAHTVRGPLARILGLVNLAVIDPEQREFYINKINEEALDMDVTLQRVTRGIEGNIHN